MASKSFIVNRKTWDQGRGTPFKKAVSLLDSATGKMCCLGFYSLSCGIDKKYIKDIGLPIDIKDEASVKKLPKWLRGTTFYNSVGQNDLELVASTNDNSRISIEEREDQLKKLFKKHKITVKFVG